MILLLLLTPALFLLATHGMDRKDDTGRVVVVAIDGLRWQELYEGVQRDTLMPFLWEMGSGQGAMLGNRHKNSCMQVSNGIWCSYAGYSEMLCGVTDDEHLSTNRKINNPNKSVLEMANASPAYRGTVSAVASWDVIPYILRTQKNQLPVDYKSAFRVSKQVRCDSVTANHALTTLGKQHPKLLFVEFCETDYYAHNGQWKEYLDAAHRNDQFIRKLWQYCQKDEFYRGKTTFIITCDHGRGESIGKCAKGAGADKDASWAHHNSKTKGSNQTWLVAFGNGVKHLGETESEEAVYTRQVAPTIARLLHIPFTSDRKQETKPIDFILE